MADPTPVVQDSILRSVKKLLNVPEEYDVFDQELIIHINSVFANLAQIGVGDPELIFSIEDDTATWTDFTRGDVGLNQVRTYMGMKVRTIFDPPGTSFTQQSMKAVVDEFEWRLQTASETP